MRWDPADPWNRASDRLVLSEGHAVPIMYAAMADLGVALGNSKAEARPMTREDAMTLRAINSPIDGHPHPQVGVPFFDAATGSLGQGICAAVGSAVSARTTPNSFPPTRATRWSSATSIRIFSLMAMAL